MKYADGTSPQGTAAYEKRGMAVDVPEWIPDNCIQCNQCSYVCPHAVIRPIAMTDEELKNAPEGTKTKPMTGVPGMQVCYGHFSSGLHRLRLLRVRVPRQEQGSAA